MHELTGRTVLVTGASKGIGQSIAIALGQAGAHVIAHYGSDREGAEQAVAAIPAERRLVLHADLAGLDSPRSLWREALAWQGRIDVLVNLSSWVAQRGSGNPHLLAYAASKGAIKALTNTLARAHAKEGV
ncbi:MAG: SDR family NAD(P)-dependent oxidoreductase, partial [Gaiellales bacterium]